MSVLENVLVGRHVKTDCWSLGILSSIFKNRNLITKEAEERDSVENTRESRFV